MSVPDDGAGRKPVLTVNLGHGNVTEVHMLNPGEHFPYFGGSRRGLWVGGKTASLILREHSPNSTRDFEGDLTHAEFWDWIAKLINSTSGKARAVIDGIEPVFDRKD